MTINYYDRTGAWVDGQPNGYYDSRGVWVPNAGVYGRDASYERRANTWEIDAQINRIADRIQRGRADGSLSYREVRSANTRLNDIRREEQYSARDGRLDERERATLLARLDNRLGLLTGGALDQVSKSPVRQQCYQCVSCLNRRHMLWAWLSLFSVMFADIYVRLCSLGVWTDWRIL